MKPTRPANQPPPPARPRPTSKPFTFNDSKDAKFGRGITGPKPLVRPRGLPTSHRDMGLGKKR